VANFVQALRYKPEDRGIDSRSCHCNFSSDRTMTLGVDSASNKKEYYEYFLEVKAAGA
jgi:hypothetical protein